jgi:hypothetical protein
MDGGAVAEREARRLVYSYARAADRIDLALLGSLFHADAAIDMGAIYRGGPEGFVPVLSGFMGGCAATRHDVANLLVVPDGTHAADAEAYVTAWHLIETPDGPRELTVLGRYLARIEARGGEWRIARWAEVIDWGRITSADRSWFDTNAELPKGARGTADLSHGLFNRVTPD